MNKMLFRKLKKRKIQTIGIIAITFLWMFVVAFSFNLYTTNQSFKDDYFKYTKVEDFNFIPEDFEIVDDLAKEYSFSYEEQYYRDFEENGTTYRVVTRTENIDIPYLIAGEITDNSEDVLINLEYSQENSIAPGDELIIQGKTYKVSGIVTLVNYIKMHVTDDGYNYDPQTQALVIADPDAVLAMEKGDISVRYLARFAENLTNEVKTENSSAIVRSNEFATVTMQNDNSSISAWNGKISIYFLLTVISLCVLSVIIVLLLIMFSYLLVNEDRKTIGILRANGMPKLRIWISYFLMILRFLLPSGLLGFLIGSAASSYFDRILGQDLSLPELTFRIPAAFLGVFTGVIVWLALLATVLGVCGIINKNIIELLKNKKIKTVSKFEKAIKKIVKPRNIEGKMKLSFAIRSKLLLILVLFSVFAAGVEFLLSYSIYNINDKMLEAQAASMNFENQVYFSSKVIDKEVENQYFAQVKGVAADDDTVVQIYALDKGNLLDIGVTEIQDGSVVLNQTSATLLKAAVGDTVILEIGDEDAEFTVQAICDRIVGKEVFADYQSLVDNGIIEEGYSGMYTNRTDINSDDESIASLLSKREILDNYQEPQEVIKSGSIILGVLGIVIPIILITITVSVLLSQNKREIAILKANGITERSMNKMIYGAYNVFLILGIAISIPYAFMILQIIFSIAVKTSGIKYPVKIDGLGIAISAGMTVAIYFGTMFVLSLKNRLSLERITYDFE